MCGISWPGLIYLPTNPCFPELFQIQANAFGQVVLQLDGIDKLQLVGPGVTSRHKKLEIVILNLPHGDVTWLQILIVIKEPFHHKDVTPSCFFRIPFLFELLVEEPQFRSGYFLIMPEPG